MKEQIVKILQIIFKDENLQISEDADLSELGLTSISLINAIVELEDYFDFEFNDDDLLVDQLNTVNKIEECIKKNLSNVANGVAIEV